MYRLMKIFVQRVTHNWQVGIRCTKYACEELEMENKGKHIKVFVFVILFNHCCSEIGKVCALALIQSAVEMIKCFNKMFK